MNWKILSRLTLMFLLILDASCSGKKDADDKSALTNSKDWKEMDDFHMIMAEAYHPYADSSDLQPVKTKATALYASADKWSNAPLPEKVNHEGMKEKLQQLKSESEALEDLVKTGTDEQIGAQLTKVHELFHGIQEEWYGGHGHHHDQEH